MQVLSRKNVLISDPCVVNMTDTQWCAEIAQHEVDRDTKYKEIEQIFDATKAVVAQYLGLNIMPIKDDETGLYRLPESNEVMPLSFFVARREILQDVSEKLQAYENQKLPEILETSVLDDELSVNDLDDFFGDLDFLDDEEALKKHMAWESPEAKQLRKQLIEVVDEKTIERELESLEDKPKNVVKSKKPRIVID